MNSSEIKGFKWLIKSGVNPEDIEFRPHKTPDFVLKDGRKFEVKRSSGNKKLHIMIQDKQFESLINDSNTKILIFNKTSDEPIILPVTKLKKGIKYIDDISINWDKNIEDCTFITMAIPRKLFDEFKRALRKVYWEEGITINKGIAELMEEFIKKNFVERKV